MWSNVAKHFQKFLGSSWCSAALTPWYQRGEASLRSGRTSRSKGRQRAGQWPGLWRWTVRWGPPLDQRRGPHTARRGPPPPPCSPRAARPAPTLTADGGRTQTACRAPGRRRGVLSTEYDILHLQVTNSPLTTVTASLSSDSPNTKMWSCSLTCISWKTESTATGSTAAIREPNSRQWSRETSPKELWASRHTPYRDRPMPSTFHKVPSTAYLQTCEQTAYISSRHY